MRLIDIENEALLKSVSLGYMSMKALWKRLKNERTVEAIPIEYIQKWCNKEPNYYSFKDFGKRLIDDWGKENEIN